MEEKDDLQTLIYAACDSLWAIQSNKLRPSRSEIKKSVKKMFEKAFGQKMKHSDEIKFF